MTKEEPGGDFAQESHLFAFSRPPATIVPHIKISPISPRIRIDAHACAVGIPVLYCHSGRHGLHFLLSGRKRKRTFQVEFKKKKPWRESMEVL